MKVPFHFDLRLLLTRLLQSVRLPEVNLEAVSALMTRLSPRERQFVGAAVVALGGVLLYLCVVNPLWEAHARLRARVAAKERELGEVMVLRRTYETLRREVERARPPGGTSISPFAFLESLTTSTLGRDKLAAINPVGPENRGGVEQEVIELKLNSVSLQELVELLYKIDMASATLRCTQLSIKKRYKDSYTFDVSLTALAFSAR